jgi:hypothetical protein
LLPQVLILAAFVANLPLLCAAIVKALQLQTVAADPATATADGDGSGDGGAAASDDTAAAAAAAALPDELAQTALSIAQAMLVKEQVG